jgi:hypothetical protein
MLRLPTRLAACATVLTVLMLTAGLADEFGPTVTFDKTIAPPGPRDFDISFVKNDIGAYILAVRAPKRSICTMHRRSPSPVSLPVAILSGPARRGAAYPTPAEARTVS